MPLDPEVHPRGEAPYVELVDSIQRHIDGHTGHVSSKKGAIMQLTHKYWLDNNIHHASLVPRTRCSAVILGALNRYSVVLGECKLCSISMVLH